MSDVYRVMDEMRKRQARIERLEKCAFGQSGGGLRIEANLTITDGGESESFSHHMYLANEDASQLCAILLKDAKEDQRKIYNFHIKMIQDFLDEIKESVGQV